MIHFNFISFFNDKKKDIEFLVSNIYIIIIVCCNPEKTCLKEYWGSLFRKKIERISLYIVKLGGLKKGRHGPGGKDKSI